MSLFSHSTPRSIEAAAYLDDTASASSMTLLSPWLLPSCNSLLRWTGSKWALLRLSLGRTSNALFVSRLNWLLRVLEGSEPKMAPVLGCETLVLVSINVFILELS